MRICPTALPYKHSRGLDKQAANVASSIAQPIFTKEPESSSQGYHAISLEKRDLTQSNPAIIVDLRSPFMHLSIILRGLMVATSSAWTGEIR
jgi:hypothetical protein